VTSRKTLVQILTFLGIVVVYILFGYLLWRYLDWYIDPDSAKEPSTAKKDLFQALGFILAGTAGVVGIYFTWRNLSISQDALQSTREAQAVERFGNAVELLGAADVEGNKTIESRVAGIYTLEGIARGSPAQLEVIVNILNSYIRNNAPNRSKGEVDSDNVTTSLDSPPEPSQDIQVGIRALSNLTALIQNRTLGAPSIDLSNTALQGVRLANAFLIGASFERTLLTRANFQRANLQGANLQGADLQEANFQGTNLQGVGLQGANLQRADLQEANFRGANFQRANLNETNLQGANLQGANLQGAGLQGANLQGADLQGAGLQGANLQRAILQGAILQRAALQRADFQGANLQGAGLQGADLQGAILQGVGLQGAILQRATIRGANLRGGNLRGADLRGADLQGADLRGVVIRGGNLQGTDLRGAIITDEQLAVTLSLQDAIMPDDQKYEDRLKDKESREESEDRPSTTLGE
jgi:uncharacterized protein YjbI with pentapeptide repeats